MNANWLSRKLLIGLAVTAVLAVVLGACGGGEPTAAPTAATRPTATSASPAVATAVPTPTRAPQPTATATAATKGQERFGGNVNLYLTATINNGGVGNDPFVNQTLGTPDAFTAQPVREQLLIFDPYQNPPSTVLVGNLVTEWKFSDDLTQLTMKTRKGVTWSDGAPFSSKDVAFTYNTTLTPPKGWTSQLRGAFAQTLDRVEAPDPETVVFYLKAPSVSFINQVAVRDANVWPAHVPLEVSYRTDKMVGTGPYVPKDFRPEISLTYQRRQDYWGTDEFGNRLPYLNTMTMFFMSDPSAIFAAFSVGQLELLHMAATFVIKGRKDDFVKAVPGVQFSSRMGGNQGFSLANKPPFDDKRVRQALDLAFDRLAYTIFDASGDGLIDYLGNTPESNGGRWSHTTQEIMSMPGRRYLDKKTGQLETSQTKMYANPDNYRKDPADIARAKALLKEAGFDKFPVDSILAHVSYARGAEGSISTWTRDLGGPIKLEVLDATSFAPRIKPAQGKVGTYTISSFPIGTASPDDPTLMLSVYLNCSRHCHGFPQDEYNKLFLEQDRTVDVAKRKQISLRLEQILRDEAWFIFGYNIFGESSAWHSHVKNVPFPATSQSTNHRLERIWTDKKR